MKDIWVSVFDVAELSDGGIYIGEIHEGRLHGKGRLDWPVGASYEGEFKDGLLHGQGTYTDMWGSRYEGDYFEGVFSGRGRIEREEGGSYEGEIHKWEMHGEGVYSYDGMEYRGVFEEGVMNGPRGNMAGRRVDLSG